MGIVEIDPKHTELFLDLRDLDRMSAFVFEITEFFEELRQDMVPPRSNKETSFKGRGFGYLPSEKVRKAI